MTGFLDLENIQVPLRAAEEANAFLHYAGLHRAEGFALWVGNREGSIFCVRETLIPAQTGHITDDGVCVSVGSEELHQLNVRLYTQQMNIIAQLHSHPASAYHSETDDTFPIATTVGCISLVIPDFARHPFSLSRCAVYRLTEKGIWSWMSPVQVRNLITITD